MESTTMELSIKDVKKWLINVTKYVIMPVIIYLLTQYQSGAEIDWTVAVNLGIGPIIDILHRFMNDNTKPL